MTGNYRFYLLFIALVSAMGGLLFGYDWVVIGGAKPFYEPFFGIAGNPAQQGWAMGCALIGCLAGALAAGACADRYGRKRMLVLAAALFVASAVGTGAADAFPAFVCYRILGGLGIGVASNLSPMYIAEIAPAELRGRLVSVNQLTIVLGILAAQITNWLVADPVPAGADAQAILASWNGQTGWRWMFWAGGVPAVLFLLLALFIPESPRWLIQRGRSDRAMRTLTKIGGEAYAAAAFGSMREAADAERPAAGAVEGLARLFRPSMRRVLVVGVVLAVFQQWCGINVIFNYAQEIFAAAGYGISDTLMNIVVTGITNVVFTFVAIFLVDRVGRRALLLVGAGGLTLIYAAMGGAYCFGIGGVWLLAIVVAAIACYAMSLAPVMWVVISEIFPNAVRGVAMSVATFALWGACFVLTYSFPLLNGALAAAGTFWLYGAICLAGFVFIRRMVPETRNRSLEELEKELIE